MAQFHYECFCMLSYDSELTYEDVLEREGYLQTKMQEILEFCGAKHIDFFPINDSLQIECVFVECDREDFRFLCAEIAELAVDGVSGRLLLVQKDLDDISVALFTNGQAHLSCLPIPESAKELAFKAEKIVPLSAKELEAAREHRVAPDPEPDRPIRQRRAGPGVQESWGNTWINTDLLQSEGSKKSIDPVNLLQSWRDQMRNRAGH